MPVLTEPPSMGDVLKYELNPNYTREVVTLLVGMPYPVGAVLGKITASGKYKLATSGGADGAQTANAVLLYAVDATLADANGIVLARGPSIVSRAGLRTITAAVTDGLDHRLTISSNLGEPVPLGTKVHFLTLVRSDADRVEIRHGAVASEVTLPVVEVLG
ncbi:head decoration protein (plasmid) [Pseudorhodobacter turbinis]|uniref:Head decoration protein n=1 Tax=Pseudorhodobacter turbinis TaxID=2500533 RepID=A0A4P8EKS4_9RHOB|nr:head decoration protein [Pseudorhodobacter turbinis]